MSQNYCPECGHETSTAAVACPNCGRPLSARPSAPPRVIIAEPSREEQSIPPWVIAPMIILGVLVLFGLFYFISQRDNAANSELAVNVNSTRTAPEPARPQDTTTTREVTVTAPVESHSETVQGTQIVQQPEIGTVMIDAKIATQKGTRQADRNTKFYLLDQDLETILSEKGVGPIDGQTIASSIGLSVAEPTKYGDFYNNMMRALKDHIKYAGITDAEGKARLGSVKPESYYLFAVTRTGNGYALWNSPVSVHAGENQLNLAPQQVIEMPRASE